MFLLYYNYKGSIDSLLKEQLNINLLLSLKRLIKSSDYTTRSLENIRDSSLTSLLKASSSQFFHMRFAQI